MPTFRPVSGTLKDSGAAREMGDGVKPSVRRTAQGTGAGTVKEHGRTPGNGGRGGVHGRVRDFHA